MWEQYRKTALPLQAMILLTVAVVYFCTGQQWVPMLLMLLVMEVGAVFGAMWAASLKGRIQTRREASPLIRRRA